MDYSMLVSVYHEDADVQMDTLIDCEDVGRMRFCIIDYLRRFDSAKWREAKIKNAFRRDSSVQNPDYYRDRFLREILFTMDPADPLRESLSDSVKSHVFTVSFRLTNHIFSHFSGIEIESFFEGHSSANSMLIDGCVVTVVNHDCLSHQFTFNSLSICFKISENVLALAWILTIFLNSIFDILNPYRHLWLLEQFLDS